MKKRIILIFMLSALSNICAYDLTTFIRAAIKTGDKELATQLLGAQLVTDAANTDITISKKLLAMKFYAKNEPAAEEAARKALPAGGVSTQQLQTIQGVTAQFATDVSKINDQAGVKTVAQKLFQAGGPGYALLDSLGKKPVADQVAAALAS